MRAIVYDRYGPLGVLEMRDEELDRERAQKVMTLKVLGLTELIRRQGPWRSLEQVELATAETGGTCAASIARLETYRQPTLKIFTIIKARRRSSHESKPPSLYKTQRGSSFAVWREFGEQLVSNRAATGGLGRSS